MRKNESFVRLKKWSEIRNNYYKVHRKTCDKLLLSIDAKINYSF